jgi:hypothetical protein
MNFIIFYTHNMTSQFFLKQPFSLPRLNSEPLPRQINNHFLCRGRETAISKVLHVAPFSLGLYYEPGLKVSQPVLSGAPTWRTFNPGS